MSHLFNRKVFFHPDLFFKNSLALLQMKQPQNSLDEDSVNATQQ